MEVLKVTTVYVHNDDKTQTIHCSDGSQGVMRVDLKDSAPYAFKFYGHQHPSFWVSHDEFHDGKGIVVKDIQGEEDFELKFV